MTRMQWDLAGSRRFEAGCDRGVLYPSGSVPVPWNGLVSVDEDDGGVTVEEYYLDGLKYMDYRSVGDYSGTLKAITYPDEFLPFDGFAEIDDGIFATNQPTRDTFGLCYRTRMGNDLSGLDYGYKLHVLYNLTAKPQTRSFGTLTKENAGEEFSWSLTGIPVPIIGFRPTCHIIIDSTNVIPGSMDIFENYLYGTATSVGALPDVATLIQMHQDVIMNPIQDTI